jgi:hypothetical protein
MLRSATKAARAVVMGTADTRPMLPTSVRTISWPTISLVSTSPRWRLDSVKRTSSVSDAPA